MTLTVIVTRDVPGRFRGFLGSAMLEIAPGIYVSPRLNRNVRERVWGVLTDWHGALQRGSVVMIRRAKAQPGGVAVDMLGEPPKDIVEIDEFLLARRKI